MPNPLLVIAKIPRPVPERWRDTQRARLVFKTEHPQEVVGDEVLAVRFPPHDSAKTFQQLQAYRGLGLRSQDERPREGGGIVDCDECPTVGSRSGSTIETTEFVETARSTAYL
jgi:hypothetical protein